MALPNLSCPALAVFFQQFVVIWYYKGRGSANQEADSSKDKASRFMLPSEEEIATCGLHAYRDSSASSCPLPPSYNLFCASPCFYSTAAIWLIHSFTAVLRLAFLSLSLVTTYQHTYEHNFLSHRLRPSRRLAIGSEQCLYILDLVRERWEDNVLRFDDPLIRSYCSFVDEKRILLPHVTIPVRLWDLTTGAVRRSCCAAAISIALPDCTFYVSPIVIRGQDSVCASSLDRAVPTPAA